MAKNKEEKFDLDFGGDDGFDSEFGDLDFGNPIPPPKNAREAVTRLGKDTGRGMWDDMKDNKLKKVGQLAQASIPGSLRTEYSQIADAYGNVSNLISDKTNEIKKTANETLKAVNKILPQNGKIANILNKLSERLEEPKEPKGPSKEEIEAQQIQEGILASLGQLQDKAHADAMIAQAVASKQHADTAQLLQNIYAENKLQRTFQYEITNKYYRKSLELQYKHLFTAREQNEIMKLGFETMKNQLEAVMLNTALPDILKARGHELLKADVMKKMRDATTGKLYKAATPFAKNLEKKIQGSIDGFLGGLRGTSEIAGAIGQMNEMGEMTGGGVGYQAGAFINDFLINYAGGKIGNKIGKNKKVQDFAFKTKDLFADPRAGLKELQKSLGKKKGIHNKLGSWLAGQTYGLTGSESMNQASYGRLDLNERANFDGRVHTSITKIIPGLLSKIYGEVKASRIAWGGEDGSKHDLLYDNKYDRFQTQSELTNTIKSELKASVKSGFTSNLSQLQMILKECGLNLSQAELGVFGQALISHMTKPGTPVNPSMIWSPAFLKTISDPKISNKIRGMAKRVQGELTKDYDKMDRLVSIMAGFKSGLPSFNSRFKELYDSGHGSILTNLGVANLSDSGNMMANQAGVTSLINSSYDGSNIQYEIPTWAIGQSSSLDARRMSNKVGAKIDKLASSVPQSIKGKISGAASVAKNAVQNSSYYNKVMSSGVVAGATAQIRSALNVADDQTLLDAFSAKASKLKDFVDENVIPGSLKDQQGHFIGIKKSYEKVLKAGEDAIAKARNKDERDKILAKLNETKAEMAANIRAIQKEGLSGPTAKRMQNNLKEKAKEIRKKLPPLPKSAEDKVVKIAETARTVTSNVIGGVKGMTGSLAERAMQNEVIAMGVDRAQSAAAQLRRGLGMSDDQTLVEYLSSTKSKAEDFLTGLPAQVKQAKPIFMELKKIHIDSVKKFEQMYENAKDPAEKERIKAEITAFTAETATILRSMMKEGLSGPTAKKFKKISQKRIKNAYKKITGVSNSTSERIASTAADSPVANSEAAQGGMGGALGGGLMQISGLRNFDMATGGSLTKIGGFMKKKFSALKQRTSGIKLEELREKFYASREFKAGYITNFWQWCSSNDYDVEELQKQEKGGGKSIWQMANSLDKKMAMFLLKTPFKALGMMFKGGKFGMKMTGKATKFALDMLPFGIGKVITGPFQAMTALAEKVVGDKEKEEKKERKGSWLSRLNIFNRKKDGGFAKGKDEGKMSKAMKGLGIAGLLGGAVMLLNKMGVSLGDVVHNVKLVYEGVSSVAKGLWDVGKWIGEKIGAAFDLLPDWMNPIKKKPKIDPVTGEPMKDENGNPIYEDSNAKEVMGAVGGATALAAGAGAAVYAVKHPIKTTKAIVKAPVKAVSFTMEIINKFVSVARKPKSRAWYDAVGKAKDLLLEKVANFLEKKGPKIAPTIDKKVGDVKRLGNKFKAAGKMLDNPKVKKKVAGKVLQKAAAKVATAVTAAATGIGAILSVGMLVWELGWTLWYMYDKDMSFIEALLYQLLEIDIRDKELKEEMVKYEEELNKELDKQEAANSGQPTTTSGGSIGSASTPIGSGSTTTPKQLTQSAVNNASYSGSGNNKKGMEYDSKYKLEKGKGWLTKKPLTKFANKEQEQYSPSPYLWAEKQNSDPKKRPAFIKLLNPELQKALVGFAEHYYDVTGKPLKINSARRTMEQQIHLWEQQSKVKYTNITSPSQGSYKKWQEHRDKVDIPAMKKAGGRHFGVNGGSVAYPNPFTTTGHLGGAAVDINVREGYPSKDTRTKHWLWDGIAAKYGLVRPMMVWNGEKYTYTAGSAEGKKYPGLNKGEDWHYQLGSSAATKALTSSFEDAPDTTSVLDNSGASGMKNLEAASKTESAVTGGGIDTSPTSNVGSSAASTVATSSAVSSAASSSGGGSSYQSAVSSVGGSSASSSGGSYSTVGDSSYASTTSGSGSTSPGMSGSGVENLLRQQLEVQSKSMGFLQDIRDALASGGSKHASATPDPIVSIRRREKFA